MGKIEVKSLIQFSEWASTSIFAYSTHTRLFLGLLDSTVFDYLIFECIRTRLYYSTNNRQIPILRFSGNLSHKTAIKLVWWVIF